MSQLPPDQAALFKQAREANLLKAWAGGKRRLSAEELAEIAHLIPADEAKPVMEKPAPAVLDPDGPRIAGRKVIYPQKLDDYAALYGYDPASGSRSLKRLVAIGKDATPIDLPPLHRPEKMPAWWERRMSHRCPQNILDAASKTSSTTAAVPPPAVANGEPPSSSPPAPRDFSGIQTLDLAENVEQLRRSLAINLKLMEEAQQGADEAIISKRMNAYKEVFDLLRKSENDLLKWQQERGLVVPRDAVRAENNRVSSVIFNAVMRLLKTIRPQLSGKSDAEQDQIWKREALECFSVLKNAKFADPLPDEQAA